MYEHATLSYPHRTYERTQAPIAESFRRAKQAEAQKGITIALCIMEDFDTNITQEAEVEQLRPTNEGEMTFMWVIDCLLRLHLPLTAFADYYSKHQDH
jgi:hypothetical protein